MTRLRPPFLAAYRAWSAASISCRRCRPSARVQLATPIDIVTRPPPSARGMDDRQLVPGGRGKPRPRPSRRRGRCRAARWRIPRRRSARPGRPGACSCPVSTAGRLSSGTGRRPGGRSWSLYCLKQSTSHISSDSGAPSRAPRCHSDAQRLVEAAPVGDAGQAVERGQLLQFDVGARPAAAGSRAGSGRLRRAAGALMWPAEW